MGSPPSLEVSCPASASASASAPAPSPVPLPPPSLFSARIRPAFRRREYPTIPRLLHSAFNATTVHEPSTCLRTILLARRWLCKTVLLSQREKNNEAERKGPPGSENQQYSDVQWFEKEGATRRYKQQTRKLLVICTYLGPTHRMYACNTSSSSRISWRSKETAISRLSSIPSLSWMYWYMIYVQGQNRYFSHTPYIINAVPNPTPYIVWNRVQERNRHSVYRAHNDSAPPTAVSYACNPYRFASD